MPDDSDDVEAWRALLRAQAGALRAIEEDRARARAISLSWYDVLLELNGATDRRMRMSELADTGDRGHVADVVLAHRHDHVSSSASDVPLPDERRVADPVLAAG